MPLFAEVRPYLDKLFAESAADGNVHVISKHRLGGMNLRTELQRIIVRAGVKQWPKLFHNLRASRESELMREYDLATVCKWIGNSPAVAARHYATSVDLDGDFKRAAGTSPTPTNVNDDGQAQQNAQWSASDRTRQAATNDNRGDVETSQNAGFVGAGRTVSDPVDTDQWAVQGSNL